MKKNEINEIIKAALYIRVSTEEQAKHGYSLSSQKQRLIEYCKEQNYMITDIYIDEGKTARTKLKNRTELLRLIEDAKQKKFNRIIIWRLDRWFRNIADYYKVQETLEANKVDWECSDEEYNTTTSNGRLHLNIKLSIAQNESDQTSDRIKFNFDRMIKNGNIIVGKQGMPLGYTSNGTEKNKRMIKDIETEEITEDMWKNILSTGSIRKTLIYINKKYNLNICYDSMRHYLMNEKYYGHYRGNDNYCPAYITKEQFDEVQSMIRRNNKMNKRHEYIFSGLLKCPICHRNLAGFTSKTTKSHGNKVCFKYPSYRCNYHYQGNCTYNKRPVEKTIETYLIENIKSTINEYIIETKKISNKQEKTPKINKEKLKQRLERLTDIYLDGKIDKEKYNLEFDKIHKQLTLANEELIEQSNNNNSIKNIEKLFNKNIMKLYENLTNENKNLFWKKIIDYIEITEENKYNIFLKN